MTRHDVLAEMYWSSSALGIIKTYSAPGNDTRRRSIKALVYIVEYPSQSWKISGLVRKSDSPFMATLTA